MAGLRVGQALRYLGLGSGVRASIFLGTLPPYATLTNRKQIVAIYIYICIRNVELVQTYNARINFVYYRYLFSISGLRELLFVFIFFLAK